MILGVHAHRSIFLVRETTGYFRTKKCTHKYHRTKSRILLKKENKRTVEIFGIPGSNENTEIVSVQITHCFIQLL